MGSFISTFVLTLFLVTPTILQAQEPGRPQKDLIAPTPSQRIELPDLAPDRRDGSPTAIDTRPARADGPAGNSSIFLVTTVNDTGAGSLRRAIEDANDNPGKDAIRFVIPGGGVHTIALQSTLDLILDPVDIDGSTQPGYVESPLIRIDGFEAGAANGFDFAVGNSMVKAVAVTRFANDGIVLGLEGNNVIEGCYVGIAPDGVTAAGNGRYGIRVLGDSNRIGNPDGNTNVISGNGSDGIEIVGPGGGDEAGTNVVRNCYVGTNAIASAAVPNAGFGVYIAKSSDDTLGGPSYSRNVISGNAKAGISIRGTLASRIVILGNNIGTDLSGLEPIGNDNGIEITQEEVPILGVLEGTPSFITIGGPGGVTGQLANTISGNRGAGIAIFQDTLLGNHIRLIGNRIGTNSFDTDTIPNALAGIFIRKYPVGGAQTGVLIGGATNDSGNVVSGNRQHGIWIRGTGARGNVLRGNHVGVTPSNQLAFLGNELGGIVLDSAGYNVIGGENGAAGNFVGRNRGGGIAILGPNAQGNILLSNAIGAKFFDVNVWAGNATNGLYLESSSNTIGARGMENTIAGSGEAGIFIYSGTGNTLRFNRIFFNLGLGIDLADAGVTRNDTLDGDSGPNNRVNFPVLDSAILGPGTTRVRGHMVGAPNTGHTIDFFKVAERNPSKFGEGDIWLDSIVVFTNNQGMVDITATLAAPVSTDEFISAIATDWTGNTSEFTRSLCLKDTDGDGILDCWETSGDGIDVNADGVIEFDLAADGAGPRHKDIFVEVDPMSGTYPMGVALEDVEDAFDFVPSELADNPDGLDGITLWVDYQAADAIPGPVEWAYPPWPEFFTAKSAHFGTLAERASPNAANILAAKRLFYRYCVWANKLSGMDIGGLAEVVGPANDFIAFMGAFSTPGGTRNQQAAVFMHELGHTLGLGHGGGDNINWKPNYYSTMNYLWAYARTDLPAHGYHWELDFSPSAMGTLQENTLPEINGVTADPNDYDLLAIPFTTTGGKVRTGWARNGIAVDWDGDGDSSGYADGPVDLNAFNGVTSPGQVLTGHADWPNLKYNFRQVPWFVDGVRPPSTGLFSIEETLDVDFTQQLFDYIDSLPPYGAVYGYLVPQMMTTDTTILGGRWAGIQVQLLAPAPPGGATFQIEVSDSNLLYLNNGNDLFFPAGQTLATIIVTAPVVDSDTAGFVRIVDAPMEARCTVRISPVQLVAADRQSTDLNVVGGFLKENYNNGNFEGCGGRYVDSLGRIHSITGREITIFVVYDGQVGPSGTSLMVWSSAPQAFAETSVVLNPGYNGDMTIDYQASPGAVFPDSMRVYCSIYSDTVSFMVYFDDGPRFTVLDLAVAGIPCQEVVTINNRGEILGRWGGSYAVWKDGSLTYVDSLPGYAIDVPTQMNDSGDIAGHVAGSGQQLAGVWRNGTTFVLPDSDLARPMTIVTGLNNNGVVIGYRDPSTGYWNDPKGFVWLGPSSVVELNLPTEALYVVPLGINDAGKVVGWTTHRFRDSSNIIYNYISSFSWTGGDPVREAFLCPWYDGSCCWAGDGPMYTNINNRGTIIGTTGGNNRVNHTGGRIAYANWPESAIWAFGPWSGEGRVEDWVTNEGNWFDLNENDDAAGAFAYDAMVVLDRKVYNLNALTDVPAGWYLRDARGILDDRRMIVNATGVGGTRGFLLVPDSATTGYPGGRAGHGPEGVCPRSELPEPVQSRSRRSGSDCLRPGGSR